jgi:F0F1-type ATP synthase membrane subunit b/b'
MGGFFFYIFLVLNGILIGIVTVIAWRHAMAHFKPAPPDPNKLRAPLPTIHVPQEMKQKLLEGAENKFETEMKRSIKQFNHDLEITSKQLTKQLEKLGTEIVKDEMKRYHNQIDAMRSQANTALNKAQSSIADHQKDLEEKMAQRKAEMEEDLKKQMEAEHERLIQQIDTKLGDAVVSFLSETLQHNVDLGAQNDYLISQLEEHKTELKKELTK